MRPAGRAWSPAAFGAATSLVGLLDIVSALTPEQRARLGDVRQVLPIVAAHFANATTAVGGLLLVMLDHGMRRRKRRAWASVVAILAVKLIAHLDDGLDAEEAVVSAALLGAVLATRRQFYAEADPRSRYRAPATFAAMRVISLGAGLILLWSRGHVIAGGRRLPKA